MNNLLKNGLFKGCSSSHCALVLILLFTPAFPVVAEDCVLTLDRLADRSLLVTDSQGNTSVPLPKDGHLLLDTLNSVSGTAISDTAYQFFISGDESYALEWISTDQPFAVSLECNADGVSSRIFRYFAVPGRDGQSVRIDLAAGVPPVLARDASGSGVPDLVVPPDVSVDGTLAEDRTPPVILHERLDNGSHRLVLMDNETDITGTDSLFYSLDGGEHYVPYTVPIELDSKRIPSIFSIGRDANGNLSLVHMFLTRGEEQTFCTRIQKERENARSILEASLADATGSILPITQDISIMAAGRSACLWRKDDTGTDLSCAACDGNYTPGVSAQQLIVFFPGTIGATNRNQFLALLEQKAADPKYDTSQFIFDQRDETILTNAIQPLATGLAPQAALLPILLEGEYVDLTGDNDVSGVSLDTALEKLKSDTGIPRLEGYELVLQGEQGLFQSDLMIRFVGMNRGINAGFPQIDSWLNNRLRMQLTTSAKSVLSSALGVMLDDTCAREKSLVFASRQAYRTSACNGSPCGSFDDYILARTSLTASQCPGTFSNENLTVFQSYAAIARGDTVVLEPLFSDECKSNDLLGETLALVSSLKEKVLTVYQAEMESLQNSNQGEHATRSANADAANTVIAISMQDPAANIVLSLTNTGVSLVDEATIHMFDDNEVNGQVVTVEIPVNSVEVITGDHASATPFFIRADASSVPPNILRTASFLLGTGDVENTALEDETFGSLQYYLFDPAEPICPNPTPAERPSSGGEG